MINNNISDFKRDVSDSDLFLPVLLEIGTEEIPARFLPGAIADIKNITAKIFSEYRLDHKEIRAYASPRRLVMTSDGVSVVQRDIVKEVFGPAKKVAFDSNGNPTRAATSFAASLGIDVTTLQIRKKGKGEYVAAIIDEKGVETKTIMPEILKKIILSLRFPKSMRWGDGNITFVRPIHWFLAMYGTETVNFEIDGIKSSNITRGHRFLSPASFQIKEISFYMSLLEHNFVIIDPEKRKRLIRSGINGLFSSDDLHPVMDEELLETVSYIVEYPVAVLCSFDEKYLQLPDELLITVMKDHQKYFAVRNSHGRLANRFVVISNTKADNAETVRAGAERVIRARFDDARFYYTEDMKKSLNDRVSELKKVTFHDELGNLFEKTERVISQVSFLAERLAPDVKIKAERAALLSKADLITGVVREFPELQGVMGRYYALNDGEDREVAIAIEEQYQPKNFGGRLPETETGAILSMSDKIDNLASFFSIGLIPSGSEDPFGLRRQAMGIISILIDRGYNISIREIFEHAIHNVPVRKNEDVLSDIINFMLQRIDFILNSLEYEQDIINAVLYLSTDKPMKDIINRIEALKKFKKDDLYNAFLLAIKRVNNIIPNPPVPSVREDLFLQEEERNLYNAFVDIKDRIKTSLEHSIFYDALRDFASITAHINSFFDRVLVMDKDEAIRANRLSLLYEIWRTGKTLADFSKLS